MIVSHPAGIRVLGNLWQFDIDIADGPLPLNLSGATVTLGLGPSSTAHAHTKLATLADQSSQPGHATAIFLPTETAPMAYPAGGRMHFQLDVAFDSTHIVTVSQGDFAVVRSML